MDADMCIIVFFLDNIRNKHCCFLLVALISCYICGLCEMQFAPLLLFISCCRLFNVLFFSLLVILRCIICLFLCLCAFKFGVFQILFKLACIRTHVLCPKRKESNVPRNRICENLSYQSPVTAITFQWPYWAKEEHYYHPYPSLKTISLTQSKSHHLHVLSA